MRAHFQKIFLCSCVIAAVFALACLPLQAQHSGNESINVMTYNIKHGRGMDDVVDIQRIADVIMEAGADVVALQEVDVGVERSGRIDIVKELAERTGLEHTVFGKNIDYQGGDYGNATISGLKNRKMYGLNSLGLRGAASSLL